MACCLNSPEICWYIFAVKLQGKFFKFHIGLPCDRSVMHVCRFGFSGVIACMLVGIVGFIFTIKGHRWEGFVIGLLGLDFLCCMGNYYVPMKQFCIHITNFVQIISFWLVGISSFLKHCLRYRFKLLIGKDTVLIKFSDLCWQLPYYQTPITVTV